MHQSLCTLLTNRYSRLLVAVALDFRNAGLSTLFGWLNAPVKLQARGYLSFRRDQRMVAAGVAVDNYYLGTN